MKNTPLEKKFQDAVRLVEETYAGTNIGYLLSQLKEAVRELQDAGMKISLEMHPRTARGRSTNISTLTVGAVMVAEGQRLDWAVSGATWQANLSASLGGVEIANFVSMRGDGKWQEPEVINAASLKEAIQNVVVNTLAESEVAARYDVSGIGVSSLDAIKPRAAQLKTPGGQP